MAMVEDKDSFRPSGWTEVTGRIGLFNVNEGRLHPADPTTYQHVLEILRDPTITVPTDPVNDQCQHQQSCQSYLLSGGTSLVRPYTFVPRQNTDHHAFLLKDVPAYQIDAWESSFNSSLPYAAWEDDQCRVFSAKSPMGAVDGSLLICVKRDGSDVRLLAGIRECGRNLDRTGNCTLDQTYPGWHSFPAFSSTIELYRLQVDISTDRHTHNILELSAKRITPAKQNLEPQNFLEAFGLILCPFIVDNSTQTSRWCNADALNNMLTLNVGWRIALAYSETWFDNEMAIQILRNLFGTVLFLFNLVYRAISVDGSVPYRPNETAPGLPAENTFLGSPAIQSSYVAPATWTVIAFIVSTVLLITVAVVAMIVSALYVDMPDLNKFPAVDGMKVVAVDPTTGEETFFGNVIGREKKRDDVIYAARGMIVRITRRVAEGQI